MQRTELLLERCKPIAWDAESLTRGEQNLEEFDTSVLLRRAEEIRNAKNRCSVCSKLNVSDISLWLDLHDHPPANLLVGPIQYALSLRRSSPHLSLAQLIEGSRALLNV